jgi:AcrR family transcriptional regulator
MRADACRNHDRLLVAAAAAFAEHGADDASLEAIAQRAGVGIGTLYRHFPNRQALLEAVYRDRVEAIRDKAYELLESCPPGEAIAGWLRFFVEFGATKRSMSEALIATLGRDSELFSLCSGMVREGAEVLLTRAKEAGQVRQDVDATDLLRLGHALIVASKVEPARDGQADRLISFLLDGIRTPEGTPSPGSPA